MAGTVANGKGRSMGEINVVPLVDVMLVLLIIFMVAAPMMVQGLEVNLPQTNSAAFKRNDDLLILSVDRRGKVFLGEEPVELEAVGRKVAAVLGGRPQAKVYLRADREVPYGVVVRVMDQTRKAGVSDLGMVTEPDRGSPAVGAGN